MPQRKQKPRPLCYWTPPPRFAWSEKEYWRTDCDRTVATSGESPEHENGFKFCPYCGLPIKVK